MTSTRKSHHRQSRSACMIAKDWKVDPKRTSRLSPTSLRIAKVVHSLNNSMRYGESRLVVIYMVAVNPPSRYCIEIPVAGQRPFEGGDIALLDSLIKSGNKGQSAQSSISSLVHTSSDGSRSPYYHRLHEDRSVRVQRAEASEGGIHQLRGGQGDGHQEGQGCSHRRSQIGIREVLRQRIEVFVGATGVDALLRRIE